MNLILRCPLFHLTFYNKMKTKVKSSSHFLSDVYYVWPILVAMLLQLTENLEVAVETRFPFSDFPALVYNRPIERQPCFPVKESTFMYIQSSFVDFVFANLPTHWNVFVNPKSIHCFWWVLDIHRVAKHLSHLRHVFPGGKTKLHISAFKLCVILGST